MVLCITDECEEIYNRKLRLWNVTVNIRFLFFIMQYFYGKLGNESSQRVRGKSVYVAKFQLTM